MSLTLQKSHKQCSLLTCWVAYLWVIVLKYTADGTPMAKPATQKEMIIRRVIFFGIRVLIDHTIARNLQQGEYSTVMLKHMTHKMYLSNSAKIKKKSNLCESPFLGCKELFNKPSRATLRDSSRQDLKVSNTFSASIISHIRNVRLLSRTEKNLLFQRISLSLVAVTTSGNDLFRTIII